MKISDVRKLDAGSLVSRLKDLKEEVFNLKMRFATQQLSNFKQLYSVKRDIARVNTVITELQKRNTISHDGV